MKHTRSYLLLFCILACNFLVSAQHIKLGGMLKTASAVDSLRVDDTQFSGEAPKGFLTRFSSKTGKLSLNLEINILHLSHLRPVNPEASVPTILTQKRTQFQAKLGLVFFLRRPKSRKKK